MTMWRFPPRTKKINGSGTNIRVAHNMFESDSLEATISLVSGDFADVVY